MFRNVISKQRGAIRQQIRTNHHGHHQELPPWAFEQAYPKGGDKKAAEAFKSHAKHEKEHAEGTTNLWRKISFFIAAPAIVATAINTYYVEAAHAKHREHLAHVSDEDWPKQYDFQNIRSKSFFWGDGDKTLFWNPVINRHPKSD
ncbi:Cytochrome c oxidase polypeptide 6A,mitochondrial [Wickerhamomyces ciferrii]|uniref:Cytochrome c oxidase subunit n=1 Tax=Wickerhamomyces ciferrii (strain ATCC 14091 / BCRC 22168 / CBS 111 / JCM 3599 / NBRC 0793 / NRRL Y-1031 F-60-10) TaxID=1206466 RepID=K0KLM4_WICCF|nr:Cytochrome c oxidase polypeptide 6A,mitochondrial [Wickerhamomyces ciferrii]CCH42023.1 Cytochrome c oxidase polypeptide 6A,mitochondrial [Wickerhamomyces ciferrii]